MANIYLMPVMVSSSGYSGGHALRKAGTKALIIPGAWIAIQGSRPFSFWLGYGKR